MCHSVDYSCFENWRHDRQAEWMEKVVRSTQFTFASTISRHILFSFIPPETSVPRRREKKLLLGRYSLAGAQKFAFARCCHRESDYALPNGDQVFAISTYWKGMATLDSGTVCLRLHGSSPFAVQVLFEIIKSRPTLFLLNPSCPETLSASWEKESWGSNPPWYIGQLPCEEESWGSKRPWYIWQFPWEDASCGSNPVTDTLNRF